MKLTGNRTRYSPLNDAIASSFLSTNIPEDLSVTASERLLGRIKERREKSSVGCSD